ncbi:collagen alpha-1(I) chain-like [Haliaeetus albicilla]|uniref:collagen alpha-1(I) chain-like n=1 Tax=Haliaeetus albicilla TaxID=8969 RepID=UPI0037E8F756
MPQPGGAGPGPGPGVRGRRCSRAGLRLRQLPPPTRQTLSPGRRGTANPCKSRSETSGRRRLPGPAARQRRGRGIGADLPGSEAGRGRAGAGQERRGGEGKGRGGGGGDGGGEQRGQPGPRPTRDSARPPRARRGAAEPAGQVRDTRRPGGGRGCRGGGGVRPEDARCPVGGDVRALPAASRGGGRALGRNPRRATSRAALGPGGAAAPTPPYGPGPPPPAVGPGPQREAGARERPREPGRRSPKPRSRAGRPAARRVPCGRRGARSGGQPAAGIPPPLQDGRRTRGGGGCPGQVAASFPRPVPEAANGGGVRGPAESPGRAAPRTRFSFERMKGTGGPPALPRCAARNVAAVPERKATFPRAGGAEPAVPRGRSEPRQQPGTFPVRSPRRGGGQLRPFPAAAAGAAPRPRHPRGGGHDGGYGPAWGNSRPLPGKRDARGAAAEGTPGRGGTGATAPGAQRGRPRAGVDGGPAATTTAPALPGRGVPPAHGRGGHSPRGRDPRGRGSRQLSLGCGNGGAEPERHRGPERLLCRGSGSSAGSPEDARVHPCPPPGLRALPVAFPVPRSPGRQQPVPPGALPGPGGVGDTGEGRGGGTAECHCAGDRNKDAAATIVDGSYAAACPAPAAESVRKSEAPGCLAEESRAAASRLAAPRAVAPAELPAHGIVAVQRVDSGLRSRVSPYANGYPSLAKCKTQLLTEASRFRKGAAGSRPSGEAEESRLRARRCCVQAEGGSVRGSVVRQFPSSLHLSRGSGTAPQQPFPPAACLEAPAGFLPPAPLPPADLWGLGDESAPAPGVGHSAAAESSALGVDVICMAKEQQLSLCESTEDTAVKLRTPSHGDRDTGQPRCTRWGRAPWVSLPTAPRGCLVCQMLKEPAGSPGTASTGHCGEVSRVSQPEMTRGGDRAQLEHGWD